MTEAARALHSMGQCGYRNCGVDLVGSAWPMGKMLFCCKRHAKAALGIEDNPCVNNFVFSPDLFERDLPGLPCLKCKEVWNQMPNDMTVPFIVVENIDERNNSYCKVGISDESIIWPMFNILDEADEEESMKEPIERYNLSKGRSFFNIQTCLLGEKKFYQVPDYWHTKGGIRIGEDDFRALPDITLWEMLEELVKDVHKERWMDKVLMAYHIYETYTG